MSGVGSQCLISLSGVGVRTTQWTRGYTRGHSGRNLGSVWMGLVVTQSNQKVQEASPEGKWMEAQERSPG